MKTGNIEKFLQGFSDANLAALLIHAQDGKLSYWSCSCLADSINPGHALLSEDEYCGGEYIKHLEDNRRLPFAAEAEAEFRDIGSDKERRTALIPLILAEQKRRGESAPVAETLEAAPVLQVG